MWGVAYFSRSWLLMVSSKFFCAAGHSESVVASSAYICSFFFRIWSYCGVREWYCFTLRWAGVSELLSRILWLTCRLTAMPIGHFKKW